MGSQFTVTIGLNHLLEQPLMFPRYTNRIDISILEPYRIYILSMDRSRVDKIARYTLDVERLG